MMSTCWPICLKIVQKWSRIILVSWQAFGDFQKNSKSGDANRIGGYGERNIRFGVREHAMGAISNGERYLHDSLPALNPNMSPTKASTTTFLVQSSPYSSTYEGTPPSPTLMMSAPQQCHSQQHSAHQAVPAKARIGQLCFRPGVHVQVQGKISV